MGRIARAFVLALVALLAVTAALPALAAPSSGGKADVVVLVLAPYVTWDDIDSDAMQVTRELAAEGAIGDLSARTDVRGFIAGALAPAVLTIGAGAPSKHDPAAIPPLSADEYFESGTAAEAYERMVGESAEGYAVVWPGLPRTQRANEDSAYGTTLGALGQAIAEGGGVTAAIGNSDVRDRARVTVRGRPAALVAMDAFGRVKFGNVTSDVTRDDDEAAYGLATDIEAFEKAFVSALDDAATWGGPTLIVLDPGDLERARVATVDVSPQVAEDEWRRALITTDKIVAMAAGHVGDGGTIMVLSPAQLVADSSPAGFGPVVVSGDGWRGMLTSPSTHRKGLVTDLDVSATVLAELGIVRPTEILGNAMQADGTDLPMAERLERLRALDRGSVSVDSVRNGVTNVYIGFAIALIIVATVLLLVIGRVRSPAAPRLAGILATVLLLVMTVPVGAKLVHAATLFPASPAIVLLLLFALSGALWLAATVLGRRLGSEMAIVSVCLITGVVMLVDQLLGAPLSFNSLFSYSPLWGARFYGIGNEGAGILVGSVLAGMGLLFDRYHDLPWVRPAILWGVPTVGLLVVVASAAPFMGANVGVAAWGIAGFGIAWLQMTGRRVTWRWVLLGILIVVLLVAAFSFLDLSGGAEGGQTHLGRAWESAEQGGGQALWQIVVRKADTNLRVLRATNWSYLFVAILVFLAYMRWHPQGEFLAVLRRYPRFAVAMTAALWAGLIGYFTEDSGIVIPALVLLYPSGAVLHIMLKRVRERWGAEEA